MDNKRKYKVTIDFGKGPFVSYIEARDLEEAQLHCSLLADLHPAVGVSLEEVTC